MIEGLFGPIVVDEHGREHVTVRKTRPNIGCLQLDHDKLGAGWSEVTRKNIRCIELPPINVLRPKMNELYLRNS